MKIRVSDIIKKNIELLFFITPIFYICAKLFSNSVFWAIKDILMYLIFLEIIVYKAYTGIKGYKQEIILIIIFFSNIVISSLIHFDDKMFWMIGIREVFVNPLIFIVIGYFLSTEQYKYSDMFVKSIMIMCFLTVLFAFVFPDLSYGLTGRLSSFWDREHEPAIIGGLSIISLFLKNKKSIIFNIIIFVSGLFCLVASESRSAFIGLFIAVLYIFGKRLNVKNLLLLIGSIGIAYFFFVNFSLIVHRDLNYNLVARTQQYSLALELIKDNFWFGIGIDKYGVLGKNVKILSYQGLSTVTMDSSILKYFVNLGFSYICTFCFLIYYAYKKNKKTSTKYMSIVIFGIVMGIVTGKLGAYPLNLYFYSLLSYLLFLGVPNEK